MLVLTFGDDARAGDPKLVAYGRHLSGECNVCHRHDGVDTGAPPIAGRNPEEFVATLTLYRSGKRTNPAMVSVAESLDERQIKALAAYFATLRKPAPKTP